MKIYISGKIKGLPKDEVIRKFTTAEQAIRNAGHVPVNPLNNGLPWDASQQEHMKADIHMLMECDAIYIQKDWKNSKGAALEVYIAAHTGIIFLYEDTNDLDKFKTTSNTE